MKRVGQKLQADYFENSGGLNNSDSPFIVPTNTAASGSRNFEYVESGSVKKRLGLEKINSSADAQTQTWGMALRNPVSGSQQVVRAAGRKIQTVNLDTGAFTDLTEDTSSAGSDFLSTSVSVPVSDASFSTADADVAWLAGGGMDDIYGAYSASKVTKNGVTPPAGSLNLTLGVGGSFASTGTLYYSVAYRKASTKAVSNATLDVSVTLTTTANSVSVDLTSISNVDTTKYDEIWIYRSAINGSEGFTTGDLVTKAAATATSFSDTGSSLLSSENVPRSGNTVLDNSDLPSGSFNYLTLFQRRLVTAKNNTIYISDVNKPESWPLINRITLATGGPITGIGVISQTTPYADTSQEVLCVFKENELYTITGTGTILSGVLDYTVKFIDVEGCASHRTIVAANGFLFWINKRGIYMWDGSGKPIYASDQIESFFELDGDLDLSKLHLAWGRYVQRKNQVVWFVSHDTYGEQKFGLKLDLRHSIPRVKQDLAGRVLSAVFIPDTFGVPLYAGKSFFPAGATREIFVVGDNTGFVYRNYQVQNDAGSGIDFQYATPFLSQGNIGVRKSYEKVIAWVDQIGDWDLTLDFWTDYRQSESERSTKAVSIQGAAGNTAALWDVAFWDRASWDDFESDFKPIVFNLKSVRNNTLGDAIKLRFNQQDADSPVQIKGFSIIYTEMGTGNK